MENFFENKLTRFKDAIIAEAVDEAHRITDELRDAREAANRLADDELHSEAQRYEEQKAAEITARHSRRVAAHTNANRHKLLEFRERCANEILDIVKARVIEFVDSNDYRTHMTGLMQKASKQLPGETAAVAYLRLEDLRLSDALQKAVPELTLDFAEGSFTLGGLQLTSKSRGIRVDMSFDSALTDMVGRYSELAANVDRSAFSDAGT